MNLLNEIAIGFAIFFATAFGFQTWQLHSADKALALANQQLGAASASLNQAIDTAKSNEASINTLTTRLTECVGTNQRVEEAAKTAAATAARAQAQRNAALRQLTEARKKLYANDATCAAWGSAPVCAGVSRGLLDTWQATRSADQDGTDRHAAPPVRRDSGRSSGRAVVAGSSSPGVL